MKANFFVPIFESIMLFCN